MKNANIMESAFITVYFDAFNLLFLRGLWSMIFGFPAGLSKQGGRAVFFLDMVLFLVFINRIVPISSFYFEPISDK